MRHLRRRTIIAGNATVPLDIVVIGDSWSAFGHHRGTTIDTITYDAQNVVINNSVNVTFAHCPSGMTTTSNPNDPRIINNQNMNGLQGFSSDTGKGKLVDAIQRAGIDISRVTVHEYACGATTAGLHEYSPGVLELSSGAFDQGMPTVKTALHGNYGIANTGVIPGGFVITDGRSAWLQKQAWLQDPGHNPGDPMLAYKDYTLCDMIAYPPSGQVMVVFTLGGNDIFGHAQSQVFIDPYTGAFDPTGQFTSIAESVASSDGASGSINRIAEAIYILNPAAEVVWTSYMNMPTDDPAVKNLNAKLPAALGPDPNNAGGLGPTGWHVYSGDGANPIRPEFLPPYDTPTNMEVTVWPAGANGVTFPATWNISSPGFFRAAAAWMQFTAQRDLTYPFLRQWLAQYWADTGAWQGSGTTASPDPSTDPIWIWIIIPILIQAGSYNWNWQHGDGVSNVEFTAWNLNGNFNMQGHTWTQIYNKISADLSDGASINNLIVLTGAQFLNFHQLLTVLSKDITTKNMAKLFRDTWRPRMAAAEAYWTHPSRNKRFLAIDVYDAGGPTPGTSQDDPLGIPTLPKDHFVEGIHLSSLGIDHWQNSIVNQIINRSHLI